MEEHISVEMRKPVELNRQKNAQLEKKNNWKRKKEKAKRATINLVKK